MQEPKCPRSLSLEGPPSNAGLPHLFHCRPPQTPVPGGFPSRRAEAGAGALCCAASPPPGDHSLLPRLTWWLPTGQEAPPAPALATSATRLVIKGRTQVHGNFR